ncbi:hypothetical protein LCGC14_1623870 [marine sediment metagenome]|uniref:PatA-like N-terminal domain-containing protein n=1 Tax=marine sediment metagenome TaxID=412755 RepID=A0A0F9KKA4_9ZZZZ
MALEGSLREFNVADILQLIFFQKKTGALVLLGKYDKFRVLFRDGNIVSADSKKRGFDRRLVWILAKRGNISQEHLDGAMEKVKTEGGKFTHHLVSGGFVTREDVQGIYSFLVNEIMSRIFTMKEGRYEFKPQAIPLDRELGVVLNTEHYLMEGVRMVDEWSVIVDRITLDDIFVRDEEAQVRLDEDEENMVIYLDGVFDVADIADLVGKDSFTVASTLLKLEERGAVYRMSMEEEHDADAPKPRRKAKPIPLLRAILTLMTLGFFAASLALYLMSPRLMHDFDASEQLYGLRLEIQAAHSKGGNYPKSISDIDPWGNKVAYKVTENGFELSSAGPDGTAESADDVY